MDHPVTIELIKLEDPDALVDPESEGAHKLAGTPAGAKMGHIKLGHGHMALLPVGAAYRFIAEEAATVMIQTIDGPETQHRWAEFCEQSSRGDSKMAMKEGVVNSEFANPRALPIMTDFNIDPADNVTGYKAFKAGNFNFRRDEYFVYVETPKGTHTMSADIFLRALMRDVAWGFFTGQSTLNRSSAQRTTTAKSTCFMAL